MNNGSTTVQTDNAAAYFQALYAGSFQQVSFNGVAAQSLALDAGTTLVKLFATQDCWVAFGVNPTAAAVGAGTKGSAVLLRGGFASYFGVPKGQNYKISVVQASSGGMLDILEAGPAT